MITEIKAKNIELRYLAKNSAVVYSNKKLLLNCVKTTAISKKLFKNYLM